MNILLTGGAGFIGSHLAERLSEDGHQVVILDELNDFHSPAVKRANLEAVLRIGPAVFCQDAIIHLAARAGVKPSLDPKVPFEEGIDRFVSWYRDTYRERELA